MHVRSVFNTSCRITLEVSYRDKKCRLPEEDDVICNPIWFLKNDSVDDAGTGTCHETVGSK